MSDCLYEPALWAVANGERVARDVSVHLESCARCSDQVEALRDHRWQLRVAGSATPLPIAAAVEERLPANRREPVSGAASAIGPGRHPANIGGYTVERLLRLGGQAEVYLASHAALPVPVVLKWAYASIADAPRMADQFTAEARLLSQLVHRHLPRVHDLGIAEQRPFLVLEYLAGATLSAWGEHPLPSREAAKLLAKVARALQAVHEFGWLHLDIQPDNIVLGVDGEPRLIDFGMSQSIAAAQHVTDTVGHGTPEYMAPEHQAGDGARVGVAADIYALGAVLHELLTGGPPQPEMIWEPRREPGLRIQPSRLERICRRALHPDPRRRYRSAADFAHDLERFAQGARWSRTVISGLVVVAGAVVWASQQLAPVAGAPWRACSSTAQAPSRQELIAGAVERLLADADVRSCDVAIILADGRLVPVADRPGRVSSSTPEIADSIAAQLNTQTGTTLLLIAAEPLTLRVPILPPGTIALATNRGISIVASPAATDDSHAAVAQLLSGLQRRLREQHRCYRALVVAAGIKSRPHGREGESPAEPPGRLTADFPQISAGSPRDPAASKTTAQSQFHGDNQSHTGRLPAAASVLAR